jgi:quinol monooxygenase YgiN
MSQQLTLVALIRAKPDKSEELGRRLLALVEPTRKEVGCINYDVHRSNDDPSLWDRSALAVSYTANPLSVTLCRTCGTIIRYSRQEQC